MDPRIQTILKIIEERQRAPGLVSSEACQLLGLSEAYFLRLFHQQVGITFGRRQREINMARAAELVKSHALSIKEIALDSGYNDISNFCRDFKHVHGVSPRQLWFRHLIVQLEHDGNAIYRLAPSEPANP
jgi:AraC-like DNA-binding protein